MAQAVGSRRILLKDRAYQELKALIQDGTLSAGTFLSERQLAERLEMSKTPIRSALERLEGEGFVVISPQQGIVVRELSLQEIIDLFDIRVALETFAMRRLAGRLAEAQINRVNENLKAQVALLAKSDVEGSTQLDAEFHLMLTEYLDNREILRTMSDLSDKLHRVVFQVLKRDPRRLRPSYDEHAAIVEALTGGDGELAAERMERHLEYGKRFLVSV